MSLKRPKRTRGRRNTAIGLRFRSGPYATLESGAEFKTDGKKKQKRKSRSIARRHSLSTTAIASRAEAPPRRTASGQELKRRSMIATAPLAAYGTSAKSKMKRRRSLAVRRPSSLGSANLSVMESIQEGQEGVISRTRARASSTGSVRPIRRRSHSISFERRKENNSRQVNIRTRGHTRRGSYAPTMTTAATARSTSASTLRRRASETRARSTMWSPRTHKRGGIK